MAKRKNSIAWVRLDGNNAPIPGTMIYRQKKPYGKFAKMYLPAGDICCGHLRNECGGLYYQDFVNYTNPTTEDYNASWPISSAADSNCNIYTVYEVGDLTPTYPNYSYPPAIQKTDGNGNVIWTKDIFNADYDYNTATIGYESTLRVDSEDNVYLLYTQAILKMDKDGNVLWCKRFDRALSSGYQDGNTINLAIDNNNNAVYVSGGIYLNPPVHGGQSRAGYITKLSTVDGSHIATRIVNLNQTNPVNTYTNNEVSDVRIDSNGNLRLAFYTQRIITVPSSSNYNYVRSVVIKMDSSLNIVWSKDINIPAYDPNTGLYSSGGIYALDIDSQNNTIITYGDGGFRNLGQAYCAVGKISDSGALLWLNTFQNLNDTSQYLGLVECSVTPNDGIILTNADVYDLNGLDPTISSRAVMKLNSDGDLQFAYGVQYNSTSQYMSYWWGNSPRSSGLSVGNTLYAASFSNDFGFIHAFPTEITLTSGVYGNYIVSNFIDQLNPISVSTTTSTQADVTTTVYTMPLTTMNMVTVDDPYIKHNLIPIP